MFVLLYYTQCTYILHCLMPFPSMHSTEYQPYFVNFINSAQSNEIQLSLHSLYYLNSLVLYPLAAAACPSGRKRRSVFTDPISGDQESVGLAPSKTTRYSPTQFNICTRKGYFQHINTKKNFPRTS
jgi:hypothetical protein